MKMGNQKKSQVTITSMNTKKMISSLALGALVLVSAQQYFSYEYQGELWAPAYVHSEDLIVGEDGSLYYYFEPGKHTIEVSRNDFFHHEIENVDGYEIRKVEVDGWRFNNRVIYVNTKPVMVRLTGYNETFSFFDEFGTVVGDEEYQKILEKKE